ncbi:hypothetical protein [Intrasporangium oryzae]|uniref:hypothetical protein n=1 Tax=Intrasporangium oryzae TaxID=412687 RepID=UPI0004B54355|nr:hypothetical protein [Intrasporangium oryzae]
MPEWCGLDLLRGWAFYITRADRHGGGYDLGEGGAKLDEWNAVLERISTHPGARPDDRPPLEGRLRPATTAASRGLSVRVIDSPEMAQARRSELDIDRDTARRLGNEAREFIRQG